MKQTVIAIVTSAALLSASHGRAQDIEGLVTGGAHTDTNRQSFFGLGGGVLLTGAKWIGVGAQGDTFYSLPYAAARFTLLVQGTVADVAGVRPFLQLGKSWGELNGRMYGAGVDYRPGSSRVGVRASYQAYLAKMYMRPDRVQPSVTLGVIWTVSSAAASP